jgi:hypothetical protein
MNEFLTSTSLIIKSGSKEKSINSYIKKVCSLLKNYENVELRANGKISS